MTDKKGLLPIVHKEIGLAVQRKISEQPGNEFLIQTIERLTEDNPCIANFVSQFGVVSGNPHLVAYVGIVVYRLLESQAEADKLDKEFFNR